MRFLTPLLVLLPTTGCIVYSSDTEPAPSGQSAPPPPPPPANYPPEILDAWAGCYWDDYNYDDIWHFEATIDDPDGPYDVVSVWVDVYDEWAGQVYVESFELFPTSDPYVWFSDWLGHTTPLDCYYGGYTVDFVAYDSYEDIDHVTVWADTYGN